jgi:TolA-binding protein
MLAYPLLLILPLAVGLSPAWSTNSSRVQSVRFGWHGTYARIVFDLPEDRPYRLLPPTDPTHILVEIDGVFSPPPQSVWRTQNPLIQEVRFHQAKTKITGEIRLAHAGRVQKHFRLSAPPRIVIDITRNSSAVPQPESIQTPRRQETETSSSVAKPGPPSSTSGTPGKTSTTPPETQVKKPQSPPAQVVPPPILPQSLSQTQLLQQAESQWNQGKLKAAQQSYTMFLDHFPDYKHNHLIMVRLADILQQQQRLGEALVDYAKVIKAYPSSEGALISRMRMAELGVQSPGLLPETEVTHFEAYHHPLQALQQIIQTYPSMPLADIARFKLGELQLHRGELQAALEAFRQLSQKSLQPALRQEVRDKLIHTLQQLLVAQQQQGAFVEALRLFMANQEYLEPEDTLHPDLLLPVAMSYAGLGLTSKAQTILQTVIEGTATPAQKVTAAIELARLLGQGEQSQAAITLLESIAPTADPALRGKVWLLLGELAVQVAQPAKALHYLLMARDLLSSPGERVRFFSLLADSYLAQGDTDRGLQALQQCAEVTAEGQESLRPESESCLFRSAGLLFADSQYESALAEYQRLLAAFPETHFRHHTLFRMAEIYRELGDEPQTTQLLGTLRDSSTNSLWQHVAADSLDDLAWRRHFREGLAVLQDSPTK